MRMRRFLRDNVLFLSHMLVVLLVLGSLLCLMPKGALHLALNGFHTQVGDCFFKYYTYVGDWVPYVIVFLLLFYKLGAATFVLASNVLAGLVTQLIKRIVCAPRPSIFFDVANNPDILPVVEGVRLHAYHSFPSGHTTTFVAVFFALAILLNGSDLRISSAVRQLGQYVCFLCAVLGGYSRIYLSQHFAADVFAGALIALVVTAALYPLFVRWSVSHSASYDWRLLLLCRK